MSEIKRPIGSGAREFRFLRYSRYSRHSRHSHDFPPTERPRSRARVDAADDSWHRCAVPAVDRDLAPLWRDDHIGRSGWIFGIFQNQTVARGRSVMRLRMGMVGGGLDAMAGELHRRAAALDSRVDLVAGALSSTPERSLAAGKSWGLARAYGSWQEMLRAEAKLPVGERIEFVTVATPNHLHARIS